MAILPVADGARLLGVHPKTLHHWLKEIKVPLAAHPTDARIKCVTHEHLQQVARVHGRPLLSPVSFLTSIRIFSDPEHYSGCKHPSIRSGPWLSGQW